MTVRGIDVEFTRQIEVAVFVSALLTEGWACHDTICYQVYDDREDFGNYHEAPDTEILGVIQVLHEGFEAQRKAFISSLEHQATGVTASVWFDFPNEVSFAFGSVPTLPGLGKLSDWNALITCAVGPLVRAGRNVLQGRFSLAPSITRAEYPERHG